MRHLFRQSLARRILIASMLSFALIFAVLAAVIFYQFFRQQDGVLDVGRRAFADSLSQVLMGYETDEQVRAAAEGAQRVFEAQMQHVRRPLNAHIQVWAHDGRRIYASLDLPQHRPHGLASATSFEWDGQHYSVTSATSPRYLIDVLDSITIQSEREVVMEVLGDLLLKMLIAFPLFLLPTWFAVHSGLRPLGALSKTLRLRPADDLTPFASDMRYEELRPVVHSLNELMQRLRYKIKQEQAFVHDAAHELQTPLAVIANQTHVLAAASTAAERVEAQRNVEQAIERAGHLVRQMVALARLDSDRQDELKTLDVAAEVRELLAPLVAVALARSIELTLDSPDCVPLYGEKGALHSIVTNLVDNALRYIGEGGHIQVEIESGNGVVTLRVRDDGPGISAADRTRVFDRYYRVAGTGVSGSGLGLAIVKQAVARMRGIIYIEDGLLGNGCAFVLVLPAYLSGGAE
jgi:signal transduction histidine kinase